MKPSSMFRLFCSAGLRVGRVVSGRHHLELHSLDC